MPVRKVRVFDPHRFSRHSDSATSLRSGALHQCNIDGTKTAEITDRSSITPQPEEWLSLSRVLRKPSFIDKLKDVPT
jgi:hypothetical protein